MVKTFRVLVACNFLIERLLLMWAREGTTEPALSEARLLVPSGCCSPAIRPLAILMLLDVRSFYVDSFTG